MANIKLKKLPLAKITKDSLGIEVTDAMIDKKDEQTVTPDKKESFDNDLTKKINSKADNISEIRQKNTTRIHPRQVYVEVNIKEKESTILNQDLSRFTKYAFDNVDAMKRLFLYKRILANNTVDIYLDKGLMIQCDCGVPIGCEVGPRADAIILRTSNTLKTNMIIMPIRFDYEAVHRKKIVTETLVETRLINGLDVAIYANIAQVRYLDKCRIYKCCEGARKEIFGPTQALRLDPAKVDELILMNYNFIKYGICPRADQ